MGLGMYGDPDALDRLAARMRAYAGEVRQDAAEHVRRGQRAEWVSTAAQRYRDRVAQDRSQVDRAADQLEQAAQVLSAHAQQVRETLAMIAHIEQEATAWFDRQASRLVDTVEGAIDSAGQTAKKLIEGVPWTEPWTDWPYRPEKLPAPGDREWLEVGRFMRGKGVF